MNVEINGPKILGYLFGNTNLPITETMRNSWIIMAFILFLCIFLTHRMQKIPKGKQALAEKAVLMIDGLVESTMGRLSGFLAVHYDADDELAVRFAGQPVLDALHHGRPEYHARLGDHHVRADHVQ
ncbi:MAG: hypothetical protein ACLVB4_06925 [Butyricicoccus sp.]